MGVHRELLDGFGSLITRLRKKVLFAFGLKGTVGKLGIFPKIWGGAGPYRWVGQGRAEFGH
jgi:hypothetical protein